MEKEIAKIFKKPLDDLPVYKDLPRLAGNLADKIICCRRYQSTDNPPHFQINCLAGRITIEGQFSKAPNSGKGTAGNYKGKLVVIKYLY
jgi:hypothetical protein